MAENGNISIGSIKCYRADNVEKRCSKNALKEIQENNWNGILIKTVDEFSNCLEEIDSKLQRKEREIEQIDTILCELFGIIHDDVKTPDSFKEEIKRKVKSSGNIKDFPEEPIDIASLVIKNVSETRVNDISELKEIAEHLLVYCNAQENENS